MSAVAATGTTSQHSRVGIIADTPLVQHLLQDVVVGAGYDVAVNTDPDRLKPALMHNETIRIWVVELENHDQWDDFVQDIESSMSCESAPDLVAAINHFRKHPGAPAQPVDMARAREESKPDPEPEPPMPDNEPDEVLHIEPEAPEAEPEVPAPAPVAELDADVDLDILEIFIDEAGELLNELEQAIEDWQAEPGNEETKGSS